jgi:hypothetical protein
MNIRLLLSALAFGLVTADAGGHPVSAATPKRAAALEITVIYAARADGGAAIDPGLRDLPQLTRDQPFVRYNVYRLLERKELPLEEGKPETYSIVNGRTLQITLVDTQSSPGPRPERRFHVRAAIGEPGKQAFLKLLDVTATESEPFFVGGQSYQGGTLFLELVVRG